MRKVYTARTSGAPSADMVKRLKDNPQLSQIYLTNIIAAQGASGAQGGDKDEACVKAGIDKIAGQLK